jgi:hypothetical protein
MACIRIDGTDSMPVTLSRAGHIESRTWLYIVMTTLNFALPLIILA